MSFLWSLLELSAALLAIAIGVLEQAERRQRNEIKERRL
jgi:hypothetical protein